MIPFILVYAFISYLVAFFGRNRKFGFWIYFLLCFIFTPLITFVIVLASDKRAVPPDAAAVKAAADAKAAAAAAAAAAASTPAPTH
jgi:hypothetical protein